MIHKSIPIHEYFGKDHLREVTHFLVVHWPDAPGWTPMDMHEYFSLNRTRHAGIQEAIGVDGSIYSFTDRDQVVFHVGDPEGYTEEIEKRFPEFTKNTYMHDPNWCSWGVEVCHPGPEGKFTQKSIDSLRRVLEFRMRNYDLDIGDVYRHHDVTGKDCPRFYVKHPEEWVAFKGSI
jgi:N-acetylmuramoyl-L-alanine amidase